MNELFAPASPTNRGRALKALGAERSMLHIGTDLQAKLDTFPASAAACCFARFVSGATREITIVLPGAYRLTGCALGGWLVLPSADERDAYWLPRAPRLHRLDEYGHLVEERDIGIRDVLVSPNK